jgi:hypothetical protein
MNFNIRVRYGVDEETMESDTPITVSAIRHDNNLRARLGYGDNVNALINGVTMPDEAIVPNGGLVVIETACNSKAS